MYFVDELKVKVFGVIEKMIQEEVVKLYFENIKHFLDLYFPQKHLELFLLGEKKKVFEN